AGRSMSPARSTTRRFNTVAYGSGPGGTRPGFPRRLPAPWEDCSRLCRPVESRTSRGGTTSRPWPSARQSWLQGASTASWSPRNSPGKLALIVLALPILVIGPPVALAASGFAWLLGAVVLVVVVPAWLLARRLKYGHAFISRLKS